MRTKHYSLGLKYNRMEKICNKIKNGNEIKTSKLNTVFRRNTPFIAQKITLKLDCRVFRASSLKPKMVLGEASHLLPTVVFLLKNFSNRWHTIIHKIETNSGILRHSKDKIEVFLDLADLY